MLKPVPPYDELGAFSVARQPARASPDVREELERLLAAQIKAGFRDRWLQTSVVITGRSDQSQSSATSVRVRPYHWGLWFLVFINLTCLWRIERHAATGS